MWAGEAPADDAQHVADMRQRRRHDAIVAGGWATAMRASRKPFGVLGLLEGQLQRAEAAKPSSSTTSWYSPRWGNLGLPRRARAGRRGSGAGAGAVAEQHGAHLRVRPEREVGVASYRRREVGDLALDHTVGLPSGLAQPLQSDTVERLSGMSGG
jgi:hypothetical protein